MTCSPLTLFDKIPKTRSAGTYILRWRLDELNWHRKTVILAIIILGFVVWLVPSMASEPNLRGVPTIPVALFTTALALYAVFEDHRRMLYAVLIILFLILGYSGFWAYSYKMPLSSLVISVQIHRFYVGSHPSIPENMSVVECNVTISNPTNVDTPPFAFENLGVYINDMRLSGCVIRWGSTVLLDGEYIHAPFTVIKAHEILNMAGPTVFIYQDHVQVENGSLEDAWKALSASYFTLTITGSFISRPAYEVGARSPFSLWILATGPFRMSQRVGGS